LKCSNKNQETPEGAKSGEERGPGRCGATRKEFSLQNALATFAVCGLALFSYTTNNPSSLVLEILHPQIYPGKMETSAAPQDIFMLKRLFYPLFQKILTISRIISDCRMSLSLTNLSKGDAKMKCQLFN
jgi:hypothetical protein